jgi:hypothetical protein
MGVGVGVTVGAVDALRAPFFAARRTCAFCRQLMRSKVCIGPSARKPSHARLGMTSTGVQWQTLWKRKIRFPPELGSDRHQVS